MVITSSDEDLILSAAWAQLSELGYGKEASELDTFHSTTGSLSENPLNDSSKVALHKPIQCLTETSPNLISASDSDDTVDLLENEKINNTKTYPRLNVDPEQIQSNHALLSKIAAIHMNTSDLSNDANNFDLTEVKSSCSSPGKANFTIRERLRRMSRKERRDLLLKDQCPNNSLLEDDASLDPNGNNVHNEPQCNDTNETQVDLDDSLLRLRRQAHYGQNRKLMEGVYPAPLAPTQNNHQDHVQKENIEAITPKFNNRICIHVYDLFSKDTLMQLPWGCVCEIGKCFTDVNTALRSIGTGVYHVGVEVNGIEYAYGATTTAGRSGIFTCIPKTSPGYQYRTSIDFGEVPLIRRHWISVVVSGKENEDNYDNPPSLKTGTAFRLVEEFVDGRDVLKDMTRDYMGIEYDLLRKNCCTFAHDACLRLGVEEQKIPSWFRNLAETGAMTQDVANATIVQPLHKVLSGCDLVNDEEFDCQDMNHMGCESGFEIIAKRNASNTKDVVVVIDAQPEPIAKSHIAFGRTTTWAY